MNGGLAITHNCKEKKIVTIINFLCFKRGQSIKALQLANIILYNIPSKPEIQISSSKSVIFVSIRISASNGYFAR